MIMAGRWIPTQKGQREDKETKNIGRMDARAGRFLKLKNEEKSHNNV